MASLAILQLCFEYMSEKTLEDNMNVSFYHYSYYDNSILYLDIL